MDHSEVREHWRSRTGFILAGAGSAVGLGNIWRFPYLAGMNGGAAFLVIYIVLTMTVGLTVLLLELCLGRASQKGSVGAFKLLADNPFWRIFGYLGLISGGFLIISYYGVITGWTIKYMVGSVTTELTSAAMTEVGSEGYLNGFFANSKEVIAYQVAAMIMTTAIVACGVGNGIERYCKILMPGLFIILLVLVIRSCTLEGALKGLEFFLKPDFSEITGKSFTDALGQGFFSLSVGMGIMITYGGYLSKSERIPGCAFMIFGIDTAVAILAGFAIFPAVFAMGLEPAQGTGLSFVTLPMVFARMPMGSFFSFLFFTLLLLAAVTSMMSLLEISVTFLIDEFKFSRIRAALLSSVTITLFGIPSAYSLSGNLNVWGMSFLDFVDYISNNLMVPITAMGICVFAGWAWLKHLRKEVTNNGLTEFGLVNFWIVGVRFIAPAAIILIMIYGLLKKFS